MSDSWPDIAQRLTETRLALGYEEQAEFCREIGVEKNVWNPFEKGSRQISLEVAKKVKKRFNIPLDWIYCGDPQALPLSVSRQLRRRVA